MILDDLCTFINGGAWSESEYVENGHPVLKVSNMKHGFVDVSELSHLSNEGMKKYQKNILKRNDLVIATVGSHPNLVNSAAGRTLTINKNISGYLLNQNAVCLRSKNTEILDQRYLGYIGQTCHFRHFIQVRGRGAASQMRIAVGEIKKYRPELPHISKQKKIAGVLSAYDDLIENNLKRIKLLEELAQNTYEEWFVRRRFPNYESIPTAPETKLPQGWTKDPLSKHVNLLRGIEPGSSNYVNEQLEGYVPFLRVGDLNKRSSDLFIDNELAKGKVCDESDVLLSLDGSPGMVSMGMYGAYSTGIRKAVIKNSKFSNAHIFAYLKSSYIQQLISAHATGATILHAGSSVKKMEIICPTQDILSKFDSIATPCFKEVLNLKRQNISLREARDILLPRLMSGMIDVEQYDPAQLMREVA